MTEPSDGKRDDVLYQTPREALQAVHRDYLYWTNRLTETSLQLSYAVIAANWVTFGSVNGILGSFWSKLSVVLVIISLALSVGGAKWMGELHRKRVEYAALATRWNVQFRAQSGKPGEWPFTKLIVLSGRILRAARSWLSLLAGLSYVIALVYHWR